MIGFKDAVSLFYSRYTDFAGRSSRAEYWWFMLFFIIATFVVAFIAGILGETIGTIVIAIWYLAHLVGLVALGIRRLHDTDRSGWWYLLTFVPIASLVLLVFFVLPGTQGPNKYGPDPYGAGTAETFS